MKAGLAGNVNGWDSPQWVGWVRLYNLTFLVGLAIAFFVFWALNWVFPVPGIDEVGPFIEADDVIDGVEKSEDRSSYLKDDTCQKRAEASVV